ncbi:hypothetical protein CHU98_g1263 [Xylaria longipes]|nr:hypothetical protein CHU98_g1263 [Xylaria longipes]
MSNTNQPTENISGLESQLVPATSEDAQDGTINPMVLDIAPLSQYITSDMDLTPQDFHDEVGFELADVPLGAFSMETTADDLHLYITSDMDLTPQDFHDEVGFELADVPLGACSVETTADDLDLVWHPPHLDTPQVDHGVHAPPNPSAHQVESLDAHVRSLGARIQALEAQHQETNNTIDKLMDWSKEMETRCQELRMAMVDIIEQVFTSLSGQ